MYIYIHEYIKNYTNRNIRDKENMACKEAISVWRNLQASKLYETCTSHFF